MVQARTIKGRRGRTPLYLDVLDRRHVVATLVLNGWDRAKAAAQLGLSRAAFQQKCVHHRLAGLWPASGPPTVSPRAEAPRPLSNGRRGRPAITGETFAQRNAQRRVAIDQMLAAGNTYEQIGASLGITRERVRQLCNKLGLDRRQGYRKRRAIADEMKVERWRRELSPEVRAAVMWFDSRDVPVTPRGRQRFEAGGLLFCVHAARVPRFTAEGYHHRYYHGGALCGDERTRYVVFVTGDLRVFIIPPRHWAESIYIPEADDGRWAGFRDRWPEELVALRSA